MLSGCSQSKQFSSKINLMVLQGVFLWKVTAGTQSRMRLEISAVPGVSNEEGSDWHNNESEMDKPGIGGIKEKE